MLYDICTRDTRENIRWHMTQVKLINMSTLLSILADLNSAVIWKFLILPLISISSRLFFRLFGIYPKALTAISITSP